MVHIGDGFKANKFDESKIYRIKTNDERTTLAQKYKLTFAAYSADAILTYHINQNTIKNIPHEYYHPGFVNTKQLKEAPAFIKILGSLFTPVIEPQEAGRILTEHILNTKAQEIDRNYYFKGKLKKTSKKMKQSKSTYEELIAFSNKLTNLELK